MREEKLLMAGINYADGTRRFGGKAEKYEKFLIRFPMDNNYKDMMAALQQNEYTEAFKHAHALKGLAGNLSLDDLHMKINPLVEALRENHLEHIDKLSKEVSESYRRIVDAIVSLKTE